MKYLVTIACLMLSANYIFSQQVDIYGKVTDTSGQPLPGATINYQSKLGTVTDTNGSFHIHTNTEKSIKLTIRFIGFKTVDTLLIIDNRTEIILNVEMTPQLTELPDIEISATYQNIFENYKYHIIDFTISKDIIYVITKKGRKSFLCTANLRGTILKELELKGGYQNFYNSCLGGVILVGSEVCAELHNIDDKLFITNEFSIDYFNKYIIPCKLKKDESLIFKNVSRHNKKIDYFRYAQNQEPIIFHTVYDEIGASVSQSYFSELISGYLRETENVELEDIDYGFERENIIADGSWNGDLQDLITTNNTHRLVLQYQALGLKEVNSDLFVLGDGIYIFDELNRQIAKVERDLNSSFKICDIEFNEDIKIISDNMSKTYFQLDETIYSIKIDISGLSLLPIKSLDHCYFNERNLLHDGVLYRLGRKSINIVRKTIFRDTLE